jgi:hypothetical protein
MSQQYLNDGEEEKVRSQPASEPERHESPHEDVADEETSSRVDEPVTMHAAPRRQRRSKNGDAVESHTEAEEANTSSSSEETDLHALEALGFTEDEAVRLIEVAVRITNSDEARDAEATRKRLQFTKWLIDQGKLDEFSLSD